MIYLDHAATSWPKPPKVLEAMTAFLARAGGNPGRSGHRLSIEAGRIVYETREALAMLLGVEDPLRIIFTPNVTYALNMVLLGLLNPGDRVVTTSIEHNAVMRPLRALERQGVQVVVVPCLPDGRLPLDAMERAIQPGTRLVVVTHASNVTGTLLPIQRIAAMAHQTGALILVDAAQTAGVYPIHVASMGLDFLAFTGHKGLLGPPGTGGLAIGAGVEVALVRPVFRGGTGSLSEREEQPEFLPDKFEVGTINGAGIAGLGAGVRYLLEHGIETVRAHEVALTRRLLEGLQEIPGVHVYGPLESAERTATVSIRLAGKRVSEVGWRLDEEYGILCRVGLHCAPAAHRTIGTFPEGTVRLSMGFSNTEEQIDAVLEALHRIAQTG